jgi:hypothetical protein
LTSCCELMVIGVPTEDCHSIFKLLFSSLLFISFLFNFLPSFCMFYRLHSPLVFFSLLFPLFRTFFIFFTPFYLVFVYFQFYKYFTFSSLEIEHPLSLGLIFYLLNTHLKIMSNLYVNVAISKLFF